MTYFELLTAIAFAAFADAPVDVATVEVGLGGAWDATNVLHAGVCVITPIGLDHTELLGDTVGEIAAEKAGIIHAGATVICAIQEEDALRETRSGAPTSVRRSARGRRLPARLADARGRRPGARD